MKTYFDPAVEIYLDKYKNHFPFPGFRDQEFREGENHTVQDTPSQASGIRSSGKVRITQCRIPLPRLQGSGVQGR